MSKSPDAFRSIGEVARLVGVATHVLRYWEEQLPQISPVRRADGRRYYRPADVALIAGLVATLRDDGMTIRGARKLISADRGAAMRERGAARLAEASGPPAAHMRPAKKRRNVDAVPADTSLTGVQHSAANDDHLWLSRLSRLAARLRESEASLPDAAEQLGRRLLVLSGR